MIKVENVETWGFEHAVRGMRLPMNSGDRSDSCIDVNSKAFSIGENDLALMKKLYKAGPSHRKYLRSIFVSMDITAPVYWIGELDTYKIGTTRNSSSLQHKGASRDFNIGDFTFDDDPTELQTIIDVVNYYRHQYVATKDYAWFRAMRQLMPMGYNYKFMFTMNYENVVTIIEQRSGHRLKEWADFIDILKNLPYVKEIMES